MHKQPAVLCAVLLALSLDLHAQPMANMTPEKWQADVDYFARELPKRHKNAFHRITREQFEAEVAALRAKAKTANDNEMLVGFLQLTGMIGDGHTRVNIVPGLLHGFPIGIARFGDQYRVIRGSGPAADIVGGRVTKINDIPIDDVVARVRTLITQGESELLIAARVPNWLYVAEALHGLGVGKSVDAARYTVVMDDGSERTVDLKMLEDSTKAQWKLAAQSQPLYRQKPAERFWFQWLPESSTLYVAFRGYENLRAKSRELWSFVDANPVKKIVFDVRDNGGGDYNVGRKYLVDELARRPKLRGYVITSTHTFSAALKTAIDFREVARATLVGETIGERPNSYSENDEMTLPNSKLSLSYSTKYLKFLEHDGLVEPDQEIVPAWADWVAGRDPVLEWIARQ
jgi:hypothetical protein